MTGAGQGAMVQFGTLTAVKRASKVELIDSAGDSIAVVQFSNYDYENAGALAEERANTIVTACNSHDALLREAEGLKANALDINWLRQLRATIECACQVFDGWKNADPGCWTDYDEQTRRELSAHLKKIDTALSPASGEK